MESGRKDLSEQSGKVDLNEIWVANMVAQQGFGDNKSTMKRTVKYEALAECLAIIKEKAKILNAGVHIPRIGCGLVGGTWDMIEPIILRNMIGTKVYIYDY